MIYAKYTDKAGQEVVNIFDTFEEYEQEATTNETNFYFDLKVSGKTYQERKADLESKAIDFSTTVGLSNFSYGELLLLNDFFETNGKRYGLLKDFRVNAIC